MTPLTSAFVSTSEQVTFISGDTRPGSKNDLKLKQILGENWRELTRQVPLLPCTPSRIVWGTWKG